MAESDILVGQISRIQNIPDYVELDREANLRKAFDLFGSRNSMAMQVIHGRTTFSSELEKVASANNHDPVAIMALEQCLGIREIKDYLLDALMAIKEGTGVEIEGLSPQFVLSEYRTAATQLDEAVSLAYRR